jgi:hypothetical protein
MAWLPESSKSPKNPGFAGPKLFGDSIPCIPKVCGHFKARLDPERSSTEEMNQNNKGMLCL